jgi:hypothetical protein
LHEVFSYAGLRIIALCLGLVVVCWLV